MKSDPTNAVRTPCAGEELLLLPQGVVFWPAERILFVADLHLGKTATFRRAGLAVPEGGMDADLTKLTDLCAATGARELVVLGDFFHAPAGRTRAMLDRCSRWIAAMRPLEICLIMGNHDRSAGRPPADWKIAIHDTSLERGPFTLIHEATGEESGFALSGHLHPSLRLRGGGQRVPCFWQSARGLVLPAFGSFTGTHGIRPETDDRVWGISDAHVIEIPSALWAK